MGRSVEYKGVTIEINFDDKRNSYSYMIYRNGKPLRGNMGIKNDVEALMRAKDYVDTRLTNEEVKPTLKNPVSTQSKNFEKIFKNTMNKNDIKLNEVDELLTEKEQSLKKKIFSLAKMESLVFSDPKLSAVYDEMAENGEEKYGYHYNETIQNMIFNDYVLNDPRYLQKYKMAIPKKKKRRDKSGINQLKKSGKLTMSKTKGVYKNKPTLGEESVEETTGAASSGAYATPYAWGSGDLMKGKKGKVMRKPIWKGGTIIQESDYLTDPTGFEKYVQELNEQIDIANPEISQKPNIPAYSDKKTNDYIINKTNAFTSDGIKSWGKGDTALQLNTINTGKMDNPELKNMEEMKNIDKVEEGISPDMYSTKEDLKQLVQSVKERTGKGLQKEHIPMLAGEALYTIAIQLANKMLPMSWNDLPDTNSMWDYIDENGGMSYDNLVAVVKEAVNDRLSEEGYSLDDMMGEGKIDEKAKSKAQQKLFGMARAVQKGELSPSKVSPEVEKIAKTVSKKDVKDFASTKTEDLPTHVDEDSLSMIGDNPMTMANKAQPMGTQSSGVQMGFAGTGGLKESDINLFEELNKELDAYSIHHNKLKKMAEDRKPSALVLRDRLGSENEKNFKKDFQQSDTKEIIDVEKELQYKDQQTNVGDDPQKLGQDIEKKVLSVNKGEAFKNVGNSDNNKGDEIPKRNLTSEEQEEVNMYRVGLGDYVYDNKPSERFEDRMKADMGEELYDQRQKKLEFRGKAPMYNKDPQPVEDTTSKKVQFNKEQTGWNERVGIKESTISGKYFDILNKKRIIDFNLSEVTEISKKLPSLFEVNLEGLGNTYTSKVNVNESAVSAMDKFKFYTDGSQVYAMKRGGTLNENTNVSKPVVNEQMNKMKHLLGYKPDSFVNTNNTKKNRGF
jgi:hypothetical protein